MIPSAYYVCRALPFTRRRLAVGLAFFTTASAIVGTVGLGLRNITQRIQMPHPTGLEVLDLTRRDHSVIFTTAYDQYALKAFDLRATDCLLKHFAHTRFDMDR
nr:hypothetical protein [Rhodoferax sp.]